MLLKHLVLLPGLDGTGELFADFITALPQPLIGAAVAYPNDRFLSYADLHPFIRASVPQSEPYVLLAESFSTPLAVAYAATNPSNLAALVMRGIRLQSRCELVTRSAGGRKTLAIQVKATPLCVGILAYRQESTSGADPESSPSASQCQAGSLECPFT